MSAANGTPLRCTWEFDAHGPGTVTFKGPDGSGELTVNLTAEEMAMFAPKQQKC